jgi:hypothetical protein
MTGLCHEDFWEHQRQERREVYVASIFRTRETQHVSWGGSVASNEVWRYLGFGEQFLLRCIFFLALTLALGKGGGRRPTAKLLAEGFRVLM